jgi:hypothetical protein
MAKNLLATNLFRSKLSNVRSCMNTSASSSRMIPFHLVAKENKPDSCSSTPYPYSSLDPYRALELIFSNGRRVWSAMLSKYSFSTSTTPFQP